MRLNVYQAGLIQHRDLDECQLMIWVVIVWAITLKPGWGKLKLFWFCHCADNSRLSYCKLWLWVVWNFWRLVMLFSSSQDIVRIFIFGDRSWQLSWGTSRVFMRLCKIISVLNHRLIFWCLQFIPWLECIRCIYLQTIMFNRILEVRRVFPWAECP